MSDRLPFTTTVRGVPSFVPFVGPEALERERGVPFELRIGANESAFGISPIAAQAMRAAVDEVSLYNDPENHELRAALAALHRVAPEEICVSAGVDDLLGLVVRLFVEPGDPVVSSMGSYPTFAFHVQGFAGRQELVPYAADRCDLDGLAAKVRQTGARLVYLANPDNPMGTWHPAPAIEEFVCQLPDGCVAIIDEAYIEFAPAETGWRMKPDDQRVIRMRTFSKAHGMAGARVGYAVANRAVVSGLEKVRNHFGVNRLAQAGVLASLADTVFIKSVVAEVEEGRADYERLATDLDMATVPSATNFVCFDFQSGETAKAAQKVLLERNVFVRMPSIAPQDRCVRVTVGTTDQRRRFAAVFADVLRVVRSR